MEQPAVTERHGIRDALRVEVPTVADERGWQARTVRRCGQSADWRMTLRRSPTPSTPCPLVMAVRAGVQASWPIGFMWRAELRGTSQELDLFGSSLPTRQPGRAYDELGSVRTHATVWAMPSSFGTIGR